MWNCRILHARWTCCFFILCNIVFFFFVKSQIRINFAEIFKSKTLFFANKKQEQRCVLWSLIDVFDQKKLAKYIIYKEKMCNYLLWHKFNSIIFFFSILLTLYLESDSKHNSIFDSLNLKSGHFRIVFIYKWKTWTCLL